MAVRLSDTLEEGPLAERAEAIGRLAFERVGTQIKVNLVAVCNESGEAGRFEAAAKLAAEKSSLACLLISATAANLEKAAAALPGKRPLLYISDPAQAEAAAAVAKDNGCPLAVRADDLEALAELTPKINSAGVEEIVLDPGTRELKATLEALTKIRRASLKGFRPLGYPTIAFTTDPDPAMQAVEASTYVAKYAGVVVTDAVETWQMLPVLTTRQDIYIDPQKPVAVEPKLYTVGEVGSDSPLLVTTNFSLSYYSVEGEVEASRMPAYILSVDTEGTSVLTAWAGQIQRRDDHQGNEEFGGRGEGLPPEAGDSRFCRRALGRGRGRIRLVCADRSEGGLGHTELPQESVEGLVLQRLSAISNQRSKKLIAEN